MTLNSKFRERYLYFFLLYISSTVLFCQVLSFDLIPDTKGEDKDLFYQSQRYYDPKLSRFTQPDNIVPTAEVIDLNRFAYVRNNPIKYNDPSGHVPNDILEGAKALYGDLADSGKSWLLAADHATYVTVGMLADLVTFPEDDPVGLIVFLGTMGAGGAAGKGRSADDILRAFDDGIARFKKGDPVAAALEKEINAHRLAAAQERTARSSRMGNMNLAHDIRHELANDSPVKGGHNPVDMALRQLNREANTVIDFFQRKKYERILAKSRNALARRLGDAFYRRLNPQPGDRRFRTFELRGEMDYKVVQEVAAGWSWGDGDQGLFTVTHKPWMDHRQGSKLRARVTIFNYNGRPLLRIRETISVQEFHKLNDHKPHDYDDEFVDFDDITGLDGPPEVYGD